MSKPARRWQIVAAAVAIALTAGIALLAWAVGLIGRPGETGYLAAIFAPDGRSVYAIRREAAAVVTGFGREFFTPPATVRVRRDRFSIVSIALDDGRLAVVETFPPTPLEGSTLKAYHGAIFGSAGGHLRWSDPSHLDYELAVTRHDTPLSRTFVTRRVWNPQAGTAETTGPWTEGWAGMGGDEPQQLSGDLEVIALRGDEGMACAIVVIRRSETTGRALADGRSCRRKYPDGYTAAVLAQYSRRADIERGERMRQTYADLVERSRRAGRSEAEAMLDANEEMSRLGFYPKPVTIVARPADCGGTAPVFEISDEQFLVGLFPDIERAIASPGTPVNKSGEYVTHRDYTTSQRINEHLAAGHTSFAVRARGTCWQLQIQK